MLNSGGVHSLDGACGFQFETIPDGIPRSSEDDDGTALLLQHVETTFLAPFLDLVANLSTPPTCIISDGFMSNFTVNAAQKLEIPIMLYWNESYLTNGYLDTVIDWVPGMEGIRIKDLNNIPEEDKQFEMSYSLWKEEPDCFQWLESKEPNSVIYVNYGSHTVMSLQDLMEFALGLDNSNHHF
ncbi:hypothetical protein Tco_1372725, partial [Tanacetum coccineum]